MRPTQRSLLARQRNNSFDGGWNEHSLRSAVRITTFHRNAVRHRQIFTTLRNICNCTPNNAFVQNNAWVVLWLPSTVRFAIFFFQESDSVLALQLSVVSWFRSDYWPQKRTETSVEDQRPLVCLLKSTTEQDFIHLVYLFRLWACGLDACPDDKKVSVLFNK